MEKRAKRLERTSVRKWAALGEQLALLYRCQVQGVVVKKRNGIYTKTGLWLEEHQRNCQTGGKQASRVFICVYFTILEFYRPQRRRTSTGGSFAQTLLQWPIFQWGVMGSRVTDGHFWNHNTFLGNCPPTLALGKHFALSKKQVLMLAQGRGRWAVSQKLVMIPFLPVLIFSFAH